MNPFPQSDPDRHAIWTMLVERDVEAFVRQDWAMIEGDFAPDSFFGIDARRRDNPDAWRAGFGSLDAYRDSWIAQARRFSAQADTDAMRAALHDATLLRDIEITGDVALAHKKFDGWLPLPGGGRERLQWQTLYVCRRRDGAWRIAAFVGYLPSPMGASVETASAKVLPSGAAQHATAGPYSPVLRISHRELVVISGQAAIDPDGQVVGDTVEEQTRATLANCEAQLASAGCTFADVFKVTVYLIDLAEWDAFNAVYHAVMPAPRPVRTAVGTALLPGLRVEVDMWAARS